MRRVVRGEPALAAAGLREESARNARMAAALTASGADPVHASAAVLLVSASLRLATDRWLQGPAHPSNRLADHFREHQAVIRQVATGRRSAQR